MEFIYSPISFFRFLFVLSLVFLVVIDVYLCLLVYLLYHHSHIHTEFMKIPSIGICFSLESNPPNLTLQKWGIWAIPTERGKRNAMPTAALPGGWRNWTETPGVRLWIDKWIWQHILLMEEMRHHLGCIKLCKQWDVYHISWLAGFCPATVSQVSENEAFDTMNLGYLCKWYALGWLVGL